VLPFNNSRSIVSTLEAITEKIKRIESGNAKINDFFQ
jgi:hypothetical protein